MPVNVNTDSNSNRNMISNNNSMVYNNNSNAYSSPSKNNKQFINKSDYFSTKQS